jgi:hypothetical protein
MTREPLFVLGSRRVISNHFAELDPHILRTAEDVRIAYTSHRRARWVVAQSSRISLLAKTAEPNDTWHRLLVLDRAALPRRELLHALFRVVVAPDDDVRLLETDDLLETVADPRAEDLFIGGLVDRDDQALVLYRGNLERLVVPFRWFKARPRGPRPDFEDFEITDSGQTVRLGEFEAAANAILFEFDSEARRRMRAKEVEQDSSFGGSLRRLRLQKGLAREDFDPISAKTIARIERGDVQAPRGGTLKAIAKRLGVAAGDISSY